jgi:ribonuclease HII
MADRPAAASERSVSRARGAMPASRVPTLREERRLLRAGHPLVAGMDEVGRGALAGPVSVGVVVVGPGTRSAPTGVRDSKLLTPAAREALVPRLRRWAIAWAVGHAEPDEIDAHGIIAALRLAGRRALADLPQLPGCVLLDGSHDWLSGAGEQLSLLEPAAPGPLPPPVHTLVKADLRCAAVAAASVLAKVERDAIMVRRAREHPGYAWDENKGYSAPEHAQALARLGPCGQHRRTWSLPGVGEPLPRPWASPELVIDVEAADVRQARAPLDLALPGPAVRHAAGGPDADDGGPAS